MLNPSKSTSPNLKKNHWTNGPFQHLNKWPLSGTSTDKTSWAGRCSPCGRGSRPGSKLHTNWLKVDWTQIDWKTIIKWIEIKGLKSKSLIDNYETILKSKRSFKTIWKTDWVQVPGPPWSSVVVDLARRPRLEGQMLLVHSCPTKDMCPFLSYYS